MMRRPSLYKILRTLQHKVLRTLTLKASFH